MEQFFYRDRLIALYVGRSRWIYVPADNFPGPLRTKLVLETGKEKNYEDTFHIAGQNCQTLK
jgi:hypothetical protein